MKECSRCGTSWSGYGQPRPREVCEGCGAYMHTCLNCHYFDREQTHSCTLPKTDFIGGRDILNYCEEFRILDTMRRARENRVSRAKQTWESLFRR